MRKGQTVRADFASLTHQYQNVYKAQWGRICWNIKIQKAASLFIWILQEALENAAFQKQEEQRSIVLYWKTQNWVWSERK